MRTSLGSGTDLPGNDPGDAAAAVLVPGAPRAGRTQEMALPFMLMGDRLAWRPLVRGQSCFDAKVVGFINMRKMTNPLAEVLDEHHPPAPGWQVRRGTAVRVVPDRGRPARHGASRLSCERSHRQRASRPGGRRICLVGKGAGDGTAAALVPDMR